MPVSDSRIDVYLSGPMGALPDGNAPAFNVAAARLREIGLTVFNPAEMFDGDMSHPYQEYMAAELKALMDVRKAVVVLPGWEEGTGSRLEVGIAAAIGLMVCEYDSHNGLGTIIYGADAGRDAVSQMVSGRNPVQEFVAQETEHPHEEAARVVLGPRGEFYDNPFDNFSRTALLWTGVLYSKLKTNVLISPEDVALCMEGVKIAREAFRHKHDNIVDGHGYWMTLEMVIAERARREEAARSRGDRTL